MTGSTAPTFQLKDQNGNLFSLNEELANGPLVLFFYPKDFTAGCTREACAFRDRYEDFQDAGVKVVGISRDDEDSHAAFSNKHSLPYTLLSDIDGKVHEAYGVKKFLGLFMSRETFLITKEGVIKYHFRSNLQFEEHMNAMLLQLSSTDFTSSNLT